MTQILIDTQTDDPRDIVAHAEMLLKLFATAAPKEAGREEASHTTISRVGAFERTEKVAILKDSAPLPPPPPPPPPPASGAEVDSAGVPWSAASHTSTKSKTIDGKWKPRKPRDGTPPPPPPQTMPSAVQVPAVTSAVPAPPVPPPPSVMPPSVSADEDIDVQSDAPGGTEVVSKGAAPGIDFPTLITRLTAGEASQEKFNEVMQKFDIQSIFQTNDGGPHADKLQDVARALGFIS